MTMSIRLEKFIVLITSMKASIAIVLTNAFGILIISSNIASASVVQDGQFSLSVRMGGSPEVSDTIGTLSQNFIIPGVYSGSVTAAAYGNAIVEGSGDIAFQPSVLVELKSAIVDGDAFRNTYIPDRGVEASVILQYFVRIIGPDGYVPIKFTGGGSIVSDSFLAGDSLGASLYVAGGSSELYTDVCVDGVGWVADCDGGSDSTQFTVSKSANVVANEDIVVSEGVNISDFLGDNMRAIVDPTFEIDPTFPQIGNYKIVYSQNLATIPEPYDTAILVPALIFLDLGRRFGYRTNLS